MVFEWKSDPDRFASVTWAGEDGLALSERFGTRGLAGDWRRPALEMVLEKGEAALPIGDCPHHVYPQVRVVSAGAKDVLMPLLESCAEVLPLESAMGELYSVNVWKQVDCLDEAASILTRFATGRVNWITKHVFRPERLRDVAVFRIPQQENSRVYCTSVFVDAVRRAGLEGFEFAIRWRG